MDVVRSNLALASRPLSVAIVEAPIGAGARDSRCRLGPRAYRESDESAQLAERGITPRWHRPPEPPDDARESTEGAIARLAEWLAQTTETLVADGTRFAVVGGDHSCATGTWAGAARALRPRPMGLVWIDAHMDMHTPATTHSGAINGMPLACLLGHGLPELAQIAGGGGTIDPRHLCVVGVRSFEPEERAFAEETGVRIIHMPEVRERGLADTLEEARAIAADGTAGYGVSLDLDALDPCDAPGVGTPESDGIRASELQAMWSRLAGDPACLGVEITEFNPAHDRGGRTLRLLGALVADAFGVGPGGTP